jgi:hypothetical protein
MVPVLKTGVGRLTEGSNPSLSAIEISPGFMLGLISMMKEVFGPEVPRVRSAGGTSQGNLPMKTCFQSRGFGVAGRDRIPPSPPI